MNPRPPLPKPRPTSASAAVPWSKEKFEDYWRRQGRTSLNGGDPERKRNPNERELAVFSSVEKRSNMRSCVFSSAFGAPVGSWTEYLFLKKNWTEYLTRPEGPISLHYWAKQWASIG